MRARAKSATERLFRALDVRCRAVSSSGAGGSESAVDGERIVVRAKRRWEETRAIAREGEGTRDGFEDGWWPELSLFETSTARARERTRERMRARVMWIRRLTVYAAVASPRTSRAESLASGFGLRD